jgi:CBS domain-containing protein
MQIHSFVKHRIDVIFVYDDFSVKEALETMKTYRYTSIPVINRNGNYIGSLSEGDLLWDILSIPGFDIRKADKRLVSQVKRQRDYGVININSEMPELISKAAEENFVPVVDDHNQFVGIITRKTLLNYFFDHNFIIL